jgi:hypothetical protein
MVNPDSGSTPFQYAVEHVGLVGWPAVCCLFYWIGRTLEKGIAEYKEDRAIIRQTKEIVDIKTDKALVIMGETKATVDTMMGNHLHALEGKVDNLTVVSSNLTGLLGDIKENTAVMAALMKDRQA